MSILITDKKTGKTLFAVAFESWTSPPRSGMMYLHASDIEDAFIQVIKAKANAFGPKARIVGISPAIGGFVKSEEKKIQVVGGL